MSAGLRRAKLAARQMAQRLGTNCLVIDTGDTTNSISRYRVRPVEDDMAFTGTVIFTVGPDNISPAPAPNPFLSHFDAVPDKHRYRCRHCGKQLAEWMAGNHLKTRHHDAYLIAKAKNPD